MGSHSQSRVTPVELVALAARLSHDEQRPRGEIVQRDRLLAARLEKEVEPGTGDDLARLRWWVEHAEDEQADETADQVHRALSLAGVTLTGLGLLLGAGVALGVFYYDGQRPVNVVATLGVFVFLQAGTLLLAILAALPAGALSRVPGLNALQEVLRLASPGRLAFVLARFMPQDMREALASAMGRSGAHRRVYGRVQLWAVLRWSQLFAFAFNLAAAAVFVALVLFTDLAFGWSTTLRIEPGTFHRLTSGVSLPWSATGHAVPTLELVERSRYFRGQAFDPVERGAWWPFVLLAMLVYGLLPRLVALTWSQVALGRVSREAMLATPGASAVLRRLHGDTAAHDAGEADGGADAGDWPDGGVGDRPVVLDWSRAVGSAGGARALLGVEVDEVLPAGGARTMEEDAAALAQAGQAVRQDAGRSRGVVLFVKQWEPPMLEVLSFLRSLRESVGDGVAVRVCPVSRDAEGRVVSDDPEHLGQWVRRVRTVGDPWLRVEPAPVPDIETTGNKGGNTDG